MNDPDFNPYQAPGVFDLEAQGPVSEGPQPLPWEDPDTYPRFFPRAWETLRQICLAPAEAGERVGVRTGLMKPWTFLITAMVPMVALFAGLFLLAGSALLIGGMASGAGKTELFPAAAAGGIAIGYLVLFPFLAFAGVGLLGCCIHGALWALGGTRSGMGLEQTLRLLFYGSAVTHLLQLPLQMLSMIPMLGILFALLNFPLVIGGLVFQGMALARLHRTDTWRGVVAMFSFFILACCCAGLAFALLIPAIAAAAR